MNRHPFPATLLVGLIVLAPAAPAQQASQFSPHIGYVFPTGGRQGESFRVTVGGQFLDGVNGVHVSGTGVTATVVEHVKPLTQNQFNQLREKLSELLERRQAATRSQGRFARAAPSQPATKVVWTEADEKEVAAIRARMATFQRKLPSPSIAEMVKLNVTIAADAEPGQFELRLVTPNGLTNPLVFSAGQIPEFTENEARDSAEPAEVSVTLPAVMNGQIMPGDVDRWRFKATRGQKIVVGVAARDLIPYLADAVPGWFQATVSVRDAKGAEVAYSDDYRFNPDPVLFYLIPADGEYVIEIKDAIYRGREDFVYRVTAGELPFVTSVFPMGCPAGARANVELKGWNLSSPGLTMDAREKSPGVYPVLGHRGVRVSNPTPFAVDALPEVLEKEPNNLGEKAQALVMPVIVNGRIDRPGDVDVFKLDGRAGEAVVVDVQARRLGSPVDSVIRLTDAAGKEIAFDDDLEDKGLGLLTHHADSRIATTLPTTGTYYLYLADAQHGGGPEYGYRLRVSGPQKDFALRIAPSAINVRAGGTAAVRVYALRKDGYSGPIELSFPGAPSGFVFSGARVPPKADQVTFTLTVPAGYAQGPLTLCAQGRATIDGKDVVRAAVPADDMEQAFAYHHLVPAKDLMVDVLAGKRTFRWPGNVRSVQAVSLVPGGKATVHVDVPQASFFGKLHLQLADGPDGVAIQSFTASRDGIDLVLRGDASKLKPGLEGNLIVTVGVEWAAQGKKATGRTPMGVLPAIPFKVAAAGG